MNGANGATHGAPRTFEEGFDDAAARLLDHFYPATYDPEYERRLLAQARETLWAIRPLVWPSVRNGLKRTVDKLFHRPPATERLWARLGAIALAALAARRRRYHLDVLDDLRALMIRKQADYGPGNILGAGELGLWVRVNDKLARLENLLRTGRRPANESIEDSWGDTVNYCIIAVMLSRGTFTLPLASIGESGEVKHRAA